MPRTPQPPKPGFVRKADRYCTTCDLDFSRPAEFRRHLSETLKHNPNAQRFPCQYCGKPYAQIRNLKNHERTHSGDKPEACKFPLDENEPAVAPAPRKAFTHTFRVPFEGLPASRQHSSPESEPGTLANVVSNPFLDPFDDQSMLSNQIVNLGASTVDFTKPTGIFDIVGQQVLLNYYSYSDWISADAPSPSSDSPYQ
ncbi:hypothetical protein P691DRAFT_771417 [Macrolepiota fuliginosa MF-IS2]|uniref:C2H2-type domain-containing protein n=1 Tax=Macrolepiota fuliginosa MF-IS2 TaxID=1400762 RepID=A0A9P5XPN9_9AGAR|nr:hypothetical protein P691DRAFT_771417 [Macrolepiota fuliginosa MF-IS2]